MNNIKTISRRAVRCTSAVFAVGGLLFGITHAGAWPSTSPSARQAARLKYRPPANWIRHYLGDDRYKIAGGTWKVVSTQKDSQYHRADCPRMLRQSPGIVIGFPSPAHGREAGYAPDPLCDPDHSRPSAYGISASAMEINNNGAGGRLVGKRIKLADGASTVVLPKGWTHTKGPSFSIRGTTITMDSLSSPTAGSIVFAIIRMPKNINLDFGRMLTPENIRSSQAMLQKAMEKNTGSSEGSAFVSQMNEIMKKQKIDAFTLGGIRGVRTRMSGAAAGMYGGGRQSIMAGTRTKIYQVSDSSTPPWSFRAAILI